MGFLLTYIYKNHERSIIKNINSRKITQSLDLLMNVMIQEVPMDVIGITEPKNFTLL